MTTLELPECPTCGGCAWSSTEMLSGGERTYKLGSDGWALVGDAVDLFETTYSCDGCGNDAGDDEDLWDRLNGI